ncbi:leucyl/phenylalanyl-tRNA--protein transferase [Sphingomicrobium astaxanthinifaciens]|uniref:leucyl/phenylalanyl-tRNA--protein transferase n=1 Tax=Sphingomicrobium astaxanthinifaciens TaxID=1227949 RepID=UPI001FCCB6CC|nr:leucyl/phenylalanyl-tRNA--protein transferase [Sphingomicrobium astaxanthinifaciens]MCJ7421797.1 leucyl/phenylalanyl-tRNA--protein transferase [Sphingomicrobium astaxanthinifaciens]
MLLRGYAAGIFPMADSADAPDIFWVEPRQRAVIPLDGFHLSRSLARRLRSGRFTVTRDTAFEAVLAGCANRDETWINPTIARAVIGLHATGHAHSIETWHEGRLVGGLYGIALGGAFFGESMFSTMTDASKVALAWLVARLRVGGFSLLDCQFMTDHLERLGAVAVPRERYLQMLSEALSPGSGASGSGDAPPAAPSSPASAGAGAGAAPRFEALDELLERTPGGGSGPSGKAIVQLLGQTS